MRCPRCGTENPQTSKFCSECGGPLIPAPAAPAPEPVKVPPPPPVPAAPPPAPTTIPASSRNPESIDPTELPPTHPDWKMSSAGPLPDPPRRRIWLWILVAVGLCIFMWLMLMLTNSVISSNFAK